MGRVFVLCEDKVASCCLMNLIVEAVPGGSTAHLQSMLVTCLVACAGGRQVADCRLDGGG